MVGGFGVTKRRGRKRKAQKYKEQNVDLEKDSGFYGAHGDFLAKELGNDVGREKCKWKNKDPDGDIKSADEHQARPQQVCGNEGRGKYTG